MIERRDPSARWRGRVRRRAVAVVLAAAAATACAGAEPSATEPGEVTAGPDVRLAAALQPFDSCDEVLRWFQDEAVKRLGPDGDGSALFGGWRAGITLEDATATSARESTAGPATDSAAAAPQTAATGAARSPEFSTTNVQEAGVDEPDIVKTDGRRIVSVAGDQLRVVDVTGESPRQAGRVTLPGPSQARLLLRGDRVLAITEEHPLVAAVPGRDRSTVATPDGSRTRLTLVDLADAAAPKVTASVLVDGDYTDARMIDGRVRVVTTFDPRRLPLVYPAAPTDEAREVARKANEEVLRRSTIESWLPRVHPGDAPADDAGETLLPCERLRHPKEFSGLSTLSVITVDLGRDSLDLADTSGVTARGESVYASDRTLYVATTAVPEPRATTPGTGPDETSSSSSSSSEIVPRDPKWNPPPARTAVHAFDLTAAGPAAYRASGFVDGAVRDQWSLSEHAGHLRVVSTTGFSGCRGCPGEQSQVSVLAEQGGELKVVGTAGDMGKGELVKSVRFLGDRGYVVTFRQVDPLYVLDLADPADPKVVGELKIPGYSTYLHPVGDGLLLGVGQDATETGQELGTKVSLFDVTDPTRPAEVDSEVIPASVTEVEQDPRAFLWWAPTRLAMVPIVRWGGRPAAEAIGYRVGDREVTEMGRVEGETAPNGFTGVRSLVIGDRVHTVTSTGIRTSALDTLAPHGWLPL